MKSETTTILEFRTCNAKLIDHQIVEVSFLGNEEVKIDDIKYLTDTVLEFMNGKSFVSLIDFSKYFGTFPLEVQRYLVNHKELDKYKYQEAFVIRKLGIRMQANFYFRMNPSMRIRVFRDKKKAIKWLYVKRKDILDTK